MTTNTPSASVVEAAWRELFASDRVSADLVAAAYSEPRLRQLFPWTGMWELHFSRCTEQRWTWDVPYIGPTAAGPDHTGPYYVEGPSRTRRVGEAGTAREAVAMVVERLPPGCGPAFVGTPGELAAYESGQEA
ncbi:DUF6193 family natural product biosynthesis protein [Streptomyces sp. S1]|uniref:DUF6193 family natural product biosynthesis protein n=1 Tax=Streptomyces sp. S1 TaxID=718288 RepID=UPI001F08D287|nr:DUF6193 family natural product biosynthesis protein [Streptomyces sp. S1]